ncbi:P-loop containing nucleoside triphosphate hydrolase protein [Mycena sanguinolenta]|nr:P-loop containing nucleoside triphosphate hydrolase protein [Mycena sanguinolenta]
MSAVALGAARTRACPGNKVFTALFYSARKKAKRSPRLADDLSPLSPSGSIHVAPKEQASSKARGKRPAFERDALPHTDREVEPDTPQERNPSFRRRSSARNEQDWSRRTGTWTTSRYGGGGVRGSQMGLREDRPQSYGLNGSRPSVSISSENRYAPAPRRPSFGLRQVDEDGPSSSRRPSGFEHREGRQSHSSFNEPEMDKYRPVWAQRPPSRSPSQHRSRGMWSDERDGGSPRHSSVARSHSERSQDAPDSEDAELNTLVASQSLKNRNQPPPAPSRGPPAQNPASKPDPPPPKKSTKEISLFEKPNVFLSRAGVPIVTKADPTTASTTSEYSPAMDQKNTLPTKFTSPPLLPGLLTCLTDVLGPLTQPTPIQALSLKWVLDPWTKGNENFPADDTETAVGTAIETKENYKEFLLASETGSGKSIAYLLPMLQALKVSEARRLAEGATTPIASKRELNPRALILAPTHELARQLTTFAKALLHDVKLRVLCASRANNPTRPAKNQLATTKGRSPSARRMKELVSFADDGALGEFPITQSSLDGKAFPVDVVVGTPMKLMEMVRGRGWEKEVEFGGGPAAAFEREKAKSEDAQGKGPKRRRGRDSVQGVGEWNSSPEMGLSEVEWVIVDEADVLFDSDFQETTRMLLADIAKARGREVSFTSLPVGLPPATPRATAESSITPGKEENKPEEKSQSKSIVKLGKSSITPLDYPFNFIVTSATIPNWLSSYLNAYHPALQRLVSPNLHRLPKTLQTEYVSWTGGTKNADIERRLRKVWASDAAQGLGPVPGSLGEMSKVLIFCNKNSKVDDLGEYLDDKGIKNVQLSGASPNRKRGSNAHLDGFLKPRARETKEKPVDDWSSSWVGEDAEADSEAAEAAPVAVLANKRKTTEAPRPLVPILKQGPPPPVKNDPMNVPHVMITTSLLSRGLDFSPNIKYVFIIDEPRNMIDFLHRAGRTGRAGANGRVVIFGKTEGRGSQRSKQVKQRIRALIA